MFGGCGARQSDLESNVITKTGVVQTKIGDEYILNTESEMINMASNKVDLENYMKKKVEVSGMFSGSTLYVDEIEISD